MNLAKKLRQSKLIDLGFCKNQWIWFHILVGSLLFNSLIAFKVILWLSIVTTISGAILWEFVEFYLENDGKWENVKKNYGSIEKWKYDTIGDILGVVLVNLTTLIIFLRI